MVVVEDGGEDVRREEEGGWGSLGGVVMVSSDMVSDEQWESGGQWQWLPMVGEGVATVSRSGEG